VDVLVADTMPEGWLRWLDWHHVVAPDNAVEIAALEADRGRYLGYVRVVARRTAREAGDVPTTIRLEYTPAHLLREAERDERGLRALADRLALAEIAGDADALADILADDVALIPPAVPAVEGKPACLELIRELMRRNASEIDRLSLVYTTTELTITGAVAIERGIYQHDFVLVETGEPHEERGQCLRVYRRTPGGAWRAHRVIWNTLPGERDD
jgi:ketosteroid isomerase-like protein